MKVEITDNVLTATATAPDDRILLAELLRHLATVAKMAERLKADPDAYSEAEAALGALMGFAYRFGVVACLSRSEVGALATAIATHGVPS